MKNTGFIRIVEEGCPKVNVGVVLYAGSRLQKVYVEGRFKYLGHSFIIHRKETGYVVTIESIGFLISEPKGKNKAGVAVRNPTQHATPEKAKQYAIERINSYLAEGKSFDELVKKHVLVYGTILKPNYVQLKIKNII